MMAVDFRFSSRSGFYFYIFRSASIFSRMGIRVCAYVCMYICMYLPDHASRWRLDLSRPDEHGVHLSFELSG